MLKNNKLSAKIYENIKEMILHQYIKCGEKIPEEKIAKQLGVSRTPIREALLRLSQEGIVNLHPHSFASVICFNEHTIHDLGVVRIALDSIAVQLAVHNGSNADFEKLYPIAKKCQNAAEIGDSYNWIRLEYEFHISLVRISQNTDLIRLMEDLYLKIRLLMFVGFIKNEKTNNMVKLHFNLIEELKKRNVDKALKIIHNHLCYFYQIDSLKFKTILFKS